MTQGLMKYFVAQRTGRQMLCDLAFHRSWKRLCPPAAVVLTLPLVIHCLAGPTPRVSGPGGLQQAPEFAFLISSWMLLMLAWGPHFENYCLPEEKPGKPFGSSVPRPYV